MVIEDVSAEVDLLSASPDPYQIEAVTPIVVLKSGSPVSARVGSPKNNDAALLDEISGGPSER